jgi:6-phosphogluconolactonase
MIAVYAADPATGKLTLIEHAALKVKTPRGFGIDPTGSLLIAGGQDSGGIELFKIDAATGKLTSAGEAKAPTPVTIAFVPIAK